MSAFDEWLVISSTMSETLHEVQLSMLEQSQLLHPNKEAPVVIGGGTGTKAAKEADGAKLLGPGKKSSARTDKGNMTSMRQRAMGAIVVGSVCN